MSLTWMVAHIPEASRPQILYLPWLLGACTMMFASWTLRVWKVLKEFLGQGRMRASMQGSLV